MKNFPWNTFFRAFLPPFFVFFLHTCLMLIFHIYRYFPNFDIAAHLAGGAAIGYTAFKLKHLAEVRGLLNIQSTHILFFGILFVVNFFAVLWEFHEFFLDFYFGTHMQEGIADTMQDLFFGMLGGSIVSIFHLFKPKRWVHKWIDKRQKM